MSPSFTAIDLAVVVLYLLGITTVGIWVGRRQRHAKDSFVADRAIPSWAVLFSIVATETIALTLISVPGVAFVRDLGFLVSVSRNTAGRLRQCCKMVPLAGPGTKGRGLTL